jgi:cytosine/adenosine deaminase-related metal-dependent hydrolase
VEHVDLLLDDGYVVTMDADRRMIAHGSIAVLDGEIVACGEATEVRRTVTATRTIHCAGKLVLPGFVDAHNHPIHFLSQGFSDDAPLYWRIANRIRPMERIITADDAYRGAKGNFATMLLNGTTCFIDPGGSYPDAVCQAAVDVGIRGLVARSAQDASTDALPIPQEYLETTDHVIDDSIALYDRWNGANGGLIGVSFSLRDAETTSDALCRRMCEEAASRHTVVQMHLITNAESEAQAHRLWGTTGLRRLESLGILGPHLSLIHMGQVSVEDAQLLARTGTSVVHCPSASMLGGMGAISSGGFLRMFDAGVLTALGTDAAAVSRFLDMIRVMYLAATAHKDVACDPEVAGCYRALEMATIDGARALRIDDRVGSLEVGKRGDAVVIDTDGPAWQPDPWFNPVANLVYAADGSSVRHVVVDGNVVVDDRRLVTCDATEAWAEALAARQSLMSKAEIELSPEWPVV